MGAGPENFKANQEENTQMVHFIQESITVKLWGWKAVTGEVKQFSAFNELYVMLEEANIWEADIRCLGGKKILISMKSPEVADYFIDNKEIWDSRLKNVEEWEGQSIATQRLAWLKITGLQVHIWSEEIMQCIGARFGEVFQNYDTDTNDLNMHFDVIGVLVKMGEKIDQKIKV
ncbi:hypothetical protein Hanom_Chr06g00559571 [Helianthus anomalus]